MAAMNTISKTLVKHINPHEDLGIWLEKIRERMKIAYLVLEFEYDSKMTAMNIIPKH